VLGRSRAAELLRRRFTALREVQALAAWLNQQPQLGCDVFARGQPEQLGLSAETEHQADVVALLGANLELFGDATDGTDMASVYRPHPLVLHFVWRPVRILRLLEATPEGQSLDRQVAEPPPSTMPAPTLLCRRSAWTSTLTASQELAKQGEVA